MMKHESKWIWMLGMAFIGIEAVFIFYYMPALKEVSSSAMIDMSFYVGERFQRIISDYGVEGLKLYQQMHHLDMIFPLVYGLFFYLIIKRKYTVLKWIPLFAMTGDYLENMMIQLLLSSYSVNLTYVSYFFTSIKFIGISFSFLILIYDLIKTRSDL